MTKKAKVLTGLKMIGLYEGISIPAAILMAVNCSFKFMYDWYDYMMQLEFPGSSDDFSNHFWMFMEILCDNYPMLIFIAVIALCAALIHTYVRIKNS